jgi:hypothetical protein
MHRAYLQPADITFMKARRSQRLHELVAEFVQEPNSEVRIALRFSNVSFDCKFVPFYSNTRMIGH